jgi:uncharacterized short protein YbdD (DUF466 family)
MAARLNHLLRRQLAALRAGSGMTNAAHDGETAPQRCCRSTPRLPFSRFWRAIRQLSGDDAYERYLAHLAACHPGTPPLSPREYFERRQLQKWNGIRRCC